MNCIIVEDEQRTAKYLSGLLRDSGYAVTILAELDSVKETVAWLKNNQTDLIFLDVQLSDGLSFEIFDNIQITTPVIFTTSYDEYITKAFEVNSISYLLKPIDPDSLKFALSKYDLLYNQKSTDIILNENIIPLNREYQKRFLVQSGTSFVIITTDDIAYFRVHTKRHVIMVTREGKQYLIDTTLKLLEQRLDPDRFFRINLQFIVYVDAIQELQSHERGRLIIITAPFCKDEMLVSIDRASAFKLWLNK